jgi:hypothetical protein
MDAVIYGPTPRAIIEKLASVPPENTSSKESIGLPEKKLCNEDLSIPAAGMCAAILKTRRIIAVIISFFLISEDLKALEKKFKIDLIIYLIV